MISWNNEKNEQLKLQRGVSFEEAEEEILAGHVLDLLPHPSRDNQRIFVIRLKGYAYAVPFVTDEEGNFFLKTVYPSRDFQKKYGGGGL